jgi:hypothetical protein
MLRVLLRGFTAVTFSQQSSSGPHHFTTNLSTVQGILTTQANFSQSKVGLIIMNCRLYHQLKLKDLGSVPRNQDPLILDTISKTVPFVNNLDPGLVVSLISTLKYIRINTGEIWNEIDKAVIKLGLKIFPKSLPQVLFSLAKIHRKNEGIWKNNEKRIISELNENPNTYEFKDLAVILAAFNYIEEGTDEFRKKIEEILVKNIKNVPIGKCLVLVDSYAQLGKIKKEVKSILCERLLEEVESINLDSLQRLLINGIILNANDTHLSSFEERILAARANLSLRQIHELFYRYGKLADPESEGFANRGQFLKALADHYYLNREAYRERIAHFHSPLANLESCIIFGLFKLKVDGFLELWEALILERFRNYNSEELEGELYEKGFFQEQKTEEEDNRRNHQ